MKCFIAPRDITPGKEYTIDIIEGITNSIAVLLFCAALDFIFSALNLIQDKLYVTTYEELINNPIYKK